MLRGRNFLRGFLRREGGDEGADLGLERRDARLEAVVALLERAHGRGEERRGAAVGDGLVALGVLGDELGSLNYALDVRSL